MNGNNIERTSRTDWDRLSKLTDEEIDYSDIPPLTDEFFVRADDDAAGIRLEQAIDEHAVSTGIGDLAHQHDHYLRGKPKQT